MEFQTLKKSYKKQIIIGALAVCVIGGVLTFNLTRAKYKVAENIDLAKGTINYKPYDFKIMAMYKSDNGTSYSEINTMPASGYVINESKSYCNMSNGSKDTTAILKTISGNHTIAKIKRNDRCYLYFDKYIPPITIDDIIASTNAKSTTPDFSVAATTDEGVYSVSDGMYGGTSYYWRGATTTNYVKFADFCWRIVRINGDKTMRLIYDGTTCHANGTNTAESIAKTYIAYNSSYNQSYYVGWTYSSAQRPSTSMPQTSGIASNAKTQSESWYSSNITGTNAQKVVDGKFCNDRNTGSGYSWSLQPSSTFYYAVRERLQTNKTPTLSCPLGDVYTTKVGAITADEVAYAGGVYGTNNSSYYLYNGQAYWAMSPGGWYYHSSSSRYANMFIVWTVGNLTTADVSSVYGLRPVINLKSDVIFSGGNGIQSNPYVVAN